MKNSDYRNVARAVLKEKGYDVQIKPGQGYLPGARLIATRARKKVDVAVKASQQRAIGFTRQANGRWRTLDAVDLVVVVVPDAHNMADAEVFGFARKPLVATFDRAWKALENAKRPTGFNAPVFIPLDEQSRKNLGHDVGNLKKFAVWSVRLPEDELDQRASGDEESYLDQFRRRFAAENGVDVGQVVVSIAGKPK